MSRSIRSKIQTKKESLIDQRRRIGAKVGAAIGAATGLVLAKKLATESIVQCDAPSVDTALSQKSVLTLDDQQSKVDAKRGGSSENPSLSVDSNVAKSRIGASTEQGAAIGSSAVKPGGRSFIIPHNNPVAFAVAPLVSCAVSCYASPLLEPVSVL